MKLSEAIRLGAMLKPQGRELYIDAGKTCAVGAALDAIGVLDWFLAQGGDPTDWFPELSRDINRPPNSRCPISGCDDSDARFNIASTIFHLNDDHRWTREQIADWVETIEHAHRPDTLEPVPVAALTPQERP